MFQSGDSRGESIFLPFSNLVETAFIPWWVALCSTFKASNDKLSLFQNTMSQILTLLLPSDPFKDPCDCVRPSSIIQETSLGKSQMINNGSSIFNLNLPLSPTWAYSWVLGINMNILGRPLFYLLQTLWEKTHDVILSRLSNLFFTSGNSVKMKIFDSILGQLVNPIMPQHNFGEAVYIDCRTGHRAYNNAIETET